MSDERICELIDELGQELLNDCFDYISKVKTIVAMADDPDEFKDVVKVVDDYGTLINDLLALNNEA